MRGSYQQLWPNYREIDFNVNPDAYRWYFEAQQRIEDAREAFVRAWEESRM